MPARDTVAVQRSEAERLDLALGDTVDIYVSETVPHTVVAIWDLATSRLLWRHDVDGNTQHRSSGNDAVSELTFTPGGGQLVSAGNDGVHLWELAPILSPAAPEVR